MTLTRMAIRHAVRDRLLAANTAAGDRVYTTRKRTKWKNQVPCLAVYTEMESDPALISKGSGSQVWERPLMVAVEVVVDDSDGLPDDQVDIICQQVEVAVLGGKRFLDLPDVRGLQPAGVQFRFDGKGEKLFGAARVMFSVPYQWNVEGDPLQLVAFTHVATDWDLPAIDGVPEAVDLQELDQ